MDRRPKIILTFLLSIVLASTLFFAGSARPVQAAGVITFSPTEFMQTIKEWITKLKEIGWKKAAITALDKVSSNFINKIAQDAGNYLATGGKGQSGLQRRESFGAILRKDGEAALGDFVQDLSSETALDKLGLNLCNPTAQLKANVSLQLLDAGNPVPLGKSGCNIRDIQQNWRNFAEANTNGSGLTANVSYGNTLGINGSSITGPGLVAGSCQGTTQGSCGFENPIASSLPDTGVCDVTTSSSQNQFVSCKQTADCIAAGLLGATCRQIAQLCSSDAECTDGSKCLKAGGSSGSCYSDADCPGDTKCVGASGANSGVPYLQVTSNFSAEEKLKFLTDLETSQSDLTFASAIQAKADELKAAKEKVATMDATACGNYKDVGSKITDDYIHKNCAEIEGLKAKTDAPSSQDEVAQLKSEGENAFWLNAAKIFGRSLISGLLKKYIRAGSFSLAEVGQRTDVNAVRENIIQQLRGGVTSPLNALNVVNNVAEAKKPSLDKVDNYDYLSLFTQCPDDRNLVELDNCTLDDNFASAIRDKKTLAEALADGVIRGDLPLISNLNTSLNSDPFCVRNGYCHSNIVRLRKYRIIPIGWEIAASLSPIDAPVTLQQVVDCFENGGACKFDAASNVYYHLIDPNWVLKAPETICKAEGFGPKLISTETAERQQYCADGISCLAEDDAGNCVGGYGYCTKENNIWRFNGEQCPAQFASCTVFTSTEDHKSVSYLGNSVDTCDASQNGCKWYSKSQDNVGTESNPNLVWNPNDRIYFNKTVAKCDADQVGCTEFVSLLTPGVNLITNGDFDYFTPSSTTNLADPNWMNDNLVDKFDGWQGSADTYTTRDNAYFGSDGLSAKNGGRVSTNAITGILADKTFTLSWFAKSGTANNCVTDVAISSATTAAQSTPVTYTKDWKRFELTKTFDVNTLDTSVNISFSTACDDVPVATADEIYIDGVKFELNSRSSGFTQYAENGKVYLKSGSRCTKDDVGCDLYTATESGFKVPGKIDSDDRCPAECVGYQSYLELPSQFDVLEKIPLPAPAPRPVDFIAKTAAACPATEVNCEEFTNEEEVAQGGEGKHYFSFVRQCVEDALGSTYYTLEGSDTAGYQVRTWRLLASDLPSGQPCTNVDIGAKNCIDASSTPATCTAADMATDLNCREFFDISGIPHYIQQDHVIASSADCQAFRRTSTGTTFYALGKDSRACSAQNNNCREYRGNQSNNLRTLFTDYFEQGNTGEWNTTNASLSTEAVSTGGHSIVNKNASDVLTTTLTRNATNKTYKIEAGREMYMEFWMKNINPVQVVFHADSTYSFPTTTMAVPNDWQQYRVGPVYIGNAIDAAPSLTIIPFGGNPLAPVYFDNIILRESLSNVFIIKDSWKTPASCDQPIPGAMLGCQEYTNKAGTAYDLRSFSKLCSNEVIGCQAFINTQNSTNPFQKIYNANDKSEVIVPEDNISYLVYSEQNRCYSQSKGCSALGAPQLNLDLPEDHPKYIDGYKVLTLINNPDTYDTTLCTDAGLFCEEYTDSKAQTVYFKNPHDRICEYKDNINISGRIQSGWFQKKSLEPGQTPVGCSDDGVLPIEDKDFRIYKNVDYDYTGWAGECSAQYDLCTEFKDPLDTQGDNAVTNADFGLVDASGQPLNWKDHIWSWPYSSTPPASWLQASPGQQIAISRLQPYGSISFGQDFSNVDGTDVFAYSVDVNVQRMTHGLNPQIGVNLSCHFDSPRDIDFCSTSIRTTTESCTSTTDCKAGGACSAGFCQYPNGNYNYTKPCGPNNSCAAGTMCYTFSWSACEGPGPDGNFNNRNDDDYTNMQCAGATGTDDTACVNRFGAGYRCLSWPYKKDLDRDYVLDYTTYLSNPYLYDKWQNVRRVVDLGADSGQRKVYECTLWLNLSNWYGYNQQSRNDYNNPGTGAPPGPRACAPVSTYDYEMSCGDTYCTIPGPDGIPGNADDTATTVRCTTSTSTVAPTVANGDAGCRLPVGSGGTGNATAICGSNVAYPAEVWWKNPLFKKAKSYFYLNNEEVDTQSCNGQVGKKDGCLLFLDMSKRDVKSYDAFSTYDKSAGNGGGLVQPVTCVAGSTTCSNDSNTIVKVRRDRQCAEWLACRSATEVFDSANNSFRQICDQVGTCNEYKPGSDIMNCANWVAPSKQRLEYGYYVNRSIDFDAADYSGYSIYNDYQVGTLSLVDVSTLGSPPTGPDGRNPDYRLVRVIDTCDSSQPPYESPCGPVDPLNPGEKLGRCFATNKCVVGIDGSRFSRDSDFVIKRSTRAWAEKDSPFPYSVVDKDQGDTRKVKFGFQDATICDTKNASCEDRYYKFQYGSTNSVTKYFSADVQLSGGAIPACVCQGGEYDNRECGTKDTGGALVCSNNITRHCTVDTDCPSVVVAGVPTTGACKDGPDGKMSPEERCPDNGSPLYLRKSDSFLNWPGFCLEPDNRANINGSQTERACLNWLPVDNAPVGYDFFNQNREAGYSYKAPAYYCLDVGLYELRVNHYFGCKCDYQCNNSLNPDPTAYAIRQGAQCGCKFNPLDPNPHTNCILGFNFGLLGCGWRHPFDKKKDCYAVPIPNGPGLYSYNNNTIAGWENPPDPSCRVLAQTVDERGENAAMTNLFWSNYNGGSGYAIGDIPIGTSTAKLGYKLDKDDKPFGSAVPNGLGFVTDKLQIQKPGTIPRAGSPYACSSSVQSCSYFDPANLSSFAVQGWTTPYVGWGNEPYTIGVRRLKEIYRKIFNLYTWQEGNLCEDMVCGRPNDPDSPNVSENGGYYGGQPCSAGDTNSCNESAGATSCVHIQDKCVNSVFNDTDPASELYQGCGVCTRVGFISESAPQKRCMSNWGDTNGDNVNDTSGLFATAAACNAADLDPGAATVTCSIAYPAGGCAPDPNDPSGRFRCFSEPFAGNDCKIPLNPNYLSCEGTPATCHYGSGATKEDTGVPCNGVSDCTGTITSDPDSLQGLLDNINSQSYCADINHKEGSYDYEAGDFCVGEPFSVRIQSTNPEPYIFSGTPVHCEVGTTYTNALGYTLQGYGPTAGNEADNICTSHGRCIPSYQVKYAPPPVSTGKVMCERQPDKGYLPLCNPDVEDCTGKKPDQIVEAPALPLDLTPSSSLNGLTSVPGYAPYIIPAKCDDTGTKCKQSTPIYQFHVPNGPLGAPNDNGFSVNNVLGSEPSPLNVVTGFQNMLASLKFYMAADKNHIPIRYVDLDWGDGLSQTRVGYYKNHLEQCDPATFGPLTPPAPQTSLDYAGSDQACRIAFRNYLHVYAYDIAYTCGRCDNNAARSCGRDDDCATGGKCTTRGIDGAVSCYRPRVMVQDNWGWCTNGVYGTTGVGCKDTQVVNSGQPPSPQSDADGYVQFKGLIMVYKDPKP